MYLPCASASALRSGRYLKKQEPLLEVLMLVAVCEIGIKAPVEETQKPQQAENSCSFCFPPALRLLIAANFILFLDLLRWSVSHVRPSLTELFLGRILMFLYLTWTSKRLVVIQSRILFVFGFLCMFVCLMPPTQIGLEAEDFEATLGLFQAEQQWSKSYKLNHCLLMWWCWVYWCILFLSSAFSPCSPSPLEQINCRLQNTVQQKHACHTGFALLASHIKEQLWMSAEADFSCTMAYHFCKNK